MAFPISLFSDENRHVRIPLLCGVALVALIGVGTVERSPAVENHLKADITESVLVDLPTVQVSVSGRDVKLTGVIDTPQERTVLAGLVRRRWGVRTVDVSGLRATGNDPSGPSVPGGATVPVPSVSAGVTSTPTALTTTTAVLATTTLPATTLGTTTAAPSTTLAPTTVAPTTTAPTTIPPTTIPPTTVPPSTIPATLIPPTTVPVTVKPSADQQALVASSLADILAQTPIVFARSVPTLGPESRLTMDLVADVLKANPNVAVQIGCYTDNRGNPVSNQKLSERRANTVRAELMSRGVAPTQMTAVGFGEQRPIASNATEAGRLQNRRVEIVPIR